MPRTIRRRGAVSTFGHGLGLVGLTHAEAAAYFGISIASVRAYSVGTRTPSVLLMQRLARLWDDIQTREELDLPAAALDRQRAMHELVDRYWTYGDLPTE